VQHPAVERLVVAEQVLKAEKVQEKTEGRGPSLLSFRLCMTIRS
jgi:hypothetical protein